MRLSLLDIEPRGPGPFGEGWDDPAFTRNGVVLSWLPDGSLNFNPFACEDAPVFSGSIPGITLQVAGRDRHYQGFLIVPVGCTSPPEWRVRREHGESTSVYGDSRFAPVPAGIYLQEGTGRIDRNSCLLTSVEEVIANIEARPPFGGRAVLGADRDRAWNLGLLRAYQQSIQPVRAAA